MWRGYPEARGQKSEDRTGEATVRIHRKRNWIVAGVGDPGEGEATVRTHSKRGFLQPRTAGAFHRIFRLDKKTAPRHKLSKFWEGAAGVNGEKRRNGLNGGEERRTDGPVPEKNPKALNSGAAGRIYGSHGGFRKLKAFQVAELCYDYTCRFCERYIPLKDRHFDQMVQAARSGFQNIGEGSEDSATSKKLEMNLTNVARSSIGELERDYRKYLKRRNLRLWEMGEPVFEEARALHPETVEDAAEWVNMPGKQQSTEERAANLGAILAAQAHWLTERLLDRQAQEFEKGGGFSERLYKARTGSSRQNGRNSEGV